MPHIKTLSAALLALSLAACGPDDDPVFPDINADNPSRADIIAVCLYDQYTYTEAECACGADHALENYSMNLRRALVVNRNAEPTPAELQLLADLTDDEVNQLALHSLSVLEACAGRPKPAFSDPE